MKALSLWQPWASLMAIGAKRCETRSWPTNYRGPVAIHAAKKWDQELRQTCLMDPFRDALKTEGNKDHLPRGCVIAVGRLHRCLSTNQYREAISAEDTNEFEFGNYAPNRFMWVFDEIWRLREPVFTRGYQALWDLDEAVTDVVLAMLPDDVEEKLRGEEN